MKLLLTSHSSRNVIFSPAMVWINIAVQVAFPLGVAFTPVMAAASKQHFLQQPAQLSTLRTETYTLASGETTASVARKFNLTLDQLREVNQFRSFVHGFDHLESGDELDVPLAPQLEVHWDDVVAVAPISTDDSQEQKVASYASQAGNFLANGANRDSTESIVLGAANSVASEEIQQWLSHLGTARVQLDADKNFSLKNSQLDLLVPLLEQKDRLVFTQGSIHRTDDRTQANLGAGLRHFTPTYMLGGNLFGDYDLSRDHARMGIGVEYWRDFFKLGANGYMRLTGWRNSPDLVDYQERPVNGWDVRTQAWIPSLPQLGGKLIYEQYYGNEVALFGVDNRQKDPHAITAGVNYTPVPLVTLGAELRQGKSGKSESRFAVDINYQLGVPWRSQLDPAAIAAMRSLAGSRYDLVERNNNIVLEYRKKETIRLHTADLITGHAGEQKSLRVSVTSKYGLERIDWDAVALIAAGGKIVKNGADYALELPAYQTDSQRGNTYTVSGVAVDTKGNHSERSDTQVTVQPPEINKQNSSFLPTSSTLPADGKSTQVMTLMVRGKDNQAVDIDVKDISLKANVPNSAMISALTRKSAGVYTVTITAGTDNEKLTLTSLVRGIELPPATTTITAALPDQSQSLIARDKATYASGDDITVTVTLKDKNGKALADEVEVLNDTTVTVPNAVLKSGSRWKDNRDGTYTAVYTADTVSADNQMTLKLSGWETAAQSDKYAITAAAALKDIRVNGYTFAKDAGFPTTGFKGATFTLQLDSGSSSDFIWKSDADWVSVKDGVVTFTDHGTGSKVTITGTPKLGKKVVTYSFALNGWFTDIKAGMFWSEANTYCLSRPGYSLPTIQQLTNDPNRDEEGRRNPSRAVGHLWSEWGDITSNNYINMVWTSELFRVGHHFKVFLGFGAGNDGSEAGNVSFEYDDITFPTEVICRKSL